MIYHIICPHCGNTVIQEKMRPSRNDKTRYVFQCPCCKQDFDLLDEQELMSFYTQVSHFIAALFVFGFSAVTAIMYNADSLDLDIYMTFICFSFMGLILVGAYLCPRLLQFSHNKLVTQWLHKKERLLKSAKILSISCILLLVLSIILVLAMCHPS